MISRGVPFDGTHLLSDPAHHVDCMSLPSSVLGWILICSMSHVHVRCHLSCRTFRFLSHAAVSFWLHAVRSLLHIQLCHRLRTTGPVRQDFPDLSLTQIPLLRKGKVITGTAYLVTGSVFLFTTVIANFFSLRLETNVCWIGFFTADSPVRPSVTIRIPAISCSDNKPTATNLLVECDLRRVLKWL